MIASDHEVINLDVQIPELRHPQTVWVDALYCLAPQSFIKHANILRSFFSPAKEIQRSVDAKIGIARRGTDVLIGAHLRQGDYRFHDQGMLYYETEEYVRLLQRVVGLFPGRKVRILLCSDIEHSVSEFSPLECVFASGTEAEDLYELANTDFIVGPPSSFSQWASFFGSVPRFVYNRKYEETMGIHREEIQLSDFTVHKSGFGRFVPS